MKPIAYQHYIHWVGLFFICLFFSKELSGQSLRQTNFDHFTTRNGLSDDIVTCIMEDSKGFIWVGTYQGISKFDSQEFEIFRQEDGNPQSLPDNLISCIFESSDGKIWVATLSNGVGVFDPKTHAFKHYPGGTADSLMITDPTARVIYEDAEKNIWVGTDNGLSRIAPDRKSFRKYYYQKSLGNQSINAPSVFDITEDKTGRIWLATNHQKLCVYHKNSQKFSDFAYTDLTLNESERTFKNFYLYNDTTLWIASNSKGLSSLNVHTGQYATFSLTNKNRATSNQSIRSITQADSLLWLATDGAGLALFDLKTHQFSTIEADPNNHFSLSSNALWSIYKDRQDIIWVGTYQEGLNRYDPRSNVFQRRNPHSSGSAIEGQPILSLLKDKNGTTWAGTDWYGLYSTDNAGNTKHYQAGAKGLSTNVAKSLAEDSLGNILIGTYNHGMSMFNPRTQAFKHFNHQASVKNSLPHNNVWCLYTDSRQISWVGTLGGGIAIYHPDTETFSTPNIPYQNSLQRLVYHIYEDAQSNLWFSTDGGIIYYQRRTNEWRLIPTLDKSLPSSRSTNKVKAIFEDNLRHLWMATDGGLIKYMPAQDEWKLFTQKEGLPELPLFNVMGDEFGNLLLVSKSHISQFDLSKETVVSYKVYDNSFSNNAFLIEANGNTLIGGRKGITAFHPKQLRKSSTPPPVYITEVAINNTHQTALVVGQQDTLHLYFDDAVVTLKYAALNYTTSEQNHFAVKLEGFDKDWQHIRHQRSVTYTNIDPGTYTFRVKASNHHHVWNEQGASIVIIMHPPFWKTAWFKALTLLFTGLVLYFIQKSRMNALKRKYEYEQLKNDQEIAQLKNSQLQTELGSAKGDLEKITMGYLHNNQKLQKIRQQINDIADKSSGSFQRMMQKLSKDIDKELKNEAYWDEFEHQFNRSHNNFLDRLKHEYPDLSQNELRICAYLKMGLDNQEIASLMNVSINSVGTYRYRIRKKMDLEERKSLTKMLLRF